MKDLAICIPTYERAKFIQEFLEICLPITEQFDIDVYIYDSSINYDTQIIVEEYQKNTGNLFYNRIDSDVHSNVKVFNIYKQFSKENRYKYIWLSSDYFRFESRLIARLKELLNINYDVIVVNNSDREPLGSREYTDINQFMIDCAWWTTCYGSTILNIASMLQNANWYYLEKKYLGMDCISFSHAGLYFEQLALINEPRIYHYSVKDRSFYWSKYRTISGWRNNTFRICCEVWPNVIRKLPDVYIDKSRAIERFYVNAESFKFTLMIGFRKDNIFNLKVFFKYYDFWQYSKLSKFELFKIAVYPRAYVENLSDRRIVKFCKKYKTIYIYGTGMVAKRCTKDFERLNIKYDGYIVSRLRKEELPDNPKVYELSPEIISDKKTGIILAVNSFNAKEIMENPIMKKICDRVLVYDC